MSNSRSYIILGAGLAGLACARTLARAGQRVRIIEKGDHVGGRVHTSKINGFLIDEGFQVLLDSYPELSYFLDIRKLELGRFKSGAMIFNGEGFTVIANPLNHPESMLATIFNGDIGFSDKTRVATLLASTKLGDASRKIEGENSAQFLRRYGFSESFMEMFWRPFFTGVFLDPDLTADAAYFKFLLRSFATGFATLPSGGMQQLAEQIAQPLGPEAVHLNSPVLSWTKSTVELASGESLSADQVICAFDPSNRSAYRKVTSFYFTSPRLRELEINGWLILVPRKFGLSVDHLALVTSINPTYSEAGAPLLSATVVGDKNITSAMIESDLEKIFKRPLELSHVTTATVSRALPQDFGSDQGFGELDGVYFCGDRWTTPSINGALESGRALAEHLLRT